MNEKSMNFSEFYAASYDKIHNSKDYMNEATQILSFIQTELSSSKISRILDFGCGTGTHLGQLSNQKFELFGYDRNDFMLNVTMENFPHLNVTSNYSEIPNEMDLVYSIFDVVSYQVTDEELQVYFQQIASKLRFGGLTVIDGWHLLGVKLDPPQVRSRSFEIDGLRICRSVEPNSDDEFRTTTLDISLIDEDTGKILSKEIHTLRAFTKEDLLIAAESVGFRNIRFRDGKDWARGLDSSSWRIMMFAEFEGADSRI